MINVDISNVWGQLSLPDLLAMEAETARAHALLTGENAPIWPDLTPEEQDHILNAAQRIRRDCEVCVVIGTDRRGSQAAVELLQGSSRNLCRGIGDPQLFFTGTSLSTRHWQQLQERLDGKDICLIYVSPAGTDLEPAIAFRGLRWMLERKYGTDEANRRIFTVTKPGTPLGQMAAEEGWETFHMPADISQGYALLTAAGLLPMAVAGIDIAQLLEGAADAREAFDQGSFDSPVWLYAAVRNLMHRSGRAAEILETFEPDFQVFGQWWQQLFGQSEGKGLLPVSRELTELLYTPVQSSSFETILRFAPGRQKHIIGPDVKDLDELNFLSGRTLDQMQEQVFFGAVEDHTDRLVPVITIDCGKINARTIGELFCFLLLSSALSGYLLGVNPFDRSEEACCRRKLLGFLGKPDSDN